MAYNVIGNGILSANKYKKSDNQPGYTGKITVNGVEYRLAGFVKENEYGKYFSLSVSEKNDEQQQVPAPVVSDDEIPF
jgi:hypothetical protein